MKINKNFIEKVIANRTVDTKSYRYTVKEFADHQEVWRLPISELNTTFSINGWETVAVIQ